MKLREALKTLNEKVLFDLNYNYNKDNWELTIFNKDFDIIEEYNNKLLKNILSEFLKEKIENEDSNEFWYLENGYLKFQVNFDNTDDTDNFFRIELLDTYFDNDEKIKDLDDLGKTSFSHRLSIQLRSHGLKPHPLEVDNYFKNREDTPRDEHGELDFECLGAMDIEKFNKDYEIIIKKGKEIDKKFKKMDEGLENIRISLKKLDMDLKKFIKDMEELKK